MQLSDVSQELDDIIRPYIKKLTHPPQFRRYLSAEDAAKLFTKLHELSIKISEKKVA